MSRFLITIFVALVVVGLLFLALYLADRYPGEDPPIVVIGQASAPRHAAIGEAEDRGAAPRHAAVFDQPAPANYRRLDSRWRDINDPQILAWSQL
jgi:hypothetical protein